MKDYQFFDDADLLLMSSAGDPDAEEELIARYKRKVSACARRFYLFGGENDDLIQEGMIGLLKAVRTYDPEKLVSFGTYAEICIRSRLLDAISFKKYSGYLSIEEQCLTDSLLVENDPETQLIENEHYEEFVESLKNRLSVYERSVLELYLLGMDYSELSRRLNKPTASVYNAVQRIRMKLSAVLNEGDISN